MFEKEVKKNRIQYDWIYNTICRLDKPACGFNYRTETHTDHLFKQQAKLHDSSRGAECTRCKTVRKHMLKNDSGKISQDIRKIGYFITSICEYKCQ